ncbi:MAG: hypothetical protein ACYSU0_17590 [Planctomycetota bacterium]
MTFREKLRLLPSRLRDAALPAWRSFDRWRRERWPVRVVVILLLGSYFLAFRLIGPDITGLLRIAVRGIFLGCEGRLVTSGARFHKAREADRLRRALRAYLDANPDADIGLARADLEGPILDADLDALVEAARRADLVPAGYTARDIRRAALSVGRSEADRLFVPARREIDKAISEAEPSPRNWSLSSWWQTALFLFGFGMQLLGVADWVTAVAWLFLCYYAARLAVILAGGRARHVAPWVPPALIMALASLAWSLWRPDWYRLTIWHFDWREFFIRAGGWAVFSFCAAYAGSRGVPAKSDRTATALATLARIGGVLLAWGVLNLFLWSLFFMLGAWRDQFADIGAVFTNSGFFMTWGIPLSMKVLGVIVGAALVVSAAVRTGRMSGGEATAREAG